MAETVVSPEVAKGTIVTRDMLARRWDEVLDTYGPTRAMGVDLAVPMPGDGSDPRATSLMAFLPLYLVATFHKCQKCGNSCRQNYRQWDRGVVLSREEVHSLKEYCRITKRNGQYLLKYPCPLLKKNNDCRRYQHRPYGCRLFPFTKVGGEAAGQRGMGTIMTCPSAKELYITTELFLQELGLYLKECERSGKQKFGIPDLETIKLKFDYNQVSAEDMAYMKKMAMSQLTKL